MAAPAGAAVRQAGEEGDDPEGRGPSRAEEAVVRSDGGSSPQWSLAANPEQAYRDMATVWVKGAAVRLRVMARVAAQQSFSAARVAAVGIKDRLEAASAVAGECARTVGQTRDMLPVVRRYVHTAYQTLEELQHSEALQLRRIEDLPSFADYVSRLSDQLEILSQELRQMPRSAVAALTLVSLRLVAVVNALGDAAIDEMLRGSTTLSKLALLLFACPGFWTAYHFRRTLLQDLRPDTPPRTPAGSPEDWPATPQTPQTPAGAETPLKPPRHSMMTEGFRSPAVSEEALSPEGSGRGAQARPAAGGSTAITRLQAAAMLARNARRMPNAFWLTTSLSAAVLLQVAKELGTRVIRGALRTRLRLLLLGGAAGAVAKAAGSEDVQAWARAMAARLAAEALPPLVRARLQLQGMSHAAARSASERVAAALRQGQGRGPRPEEKDGQARARAGSSTAACDGASAPAAQGPVFRGPTATPS